MMMMMRMIIAMILAILKCVYRRNNRYYANQTQDTKLPDLFFPFQLEQTLQPQMLHSCRAIQESNRILQNPNTHLHVVKNPLHGPQVNQMNPIHMAKSYSCKLNFNIAFDYILGSQKLAVYVFPPKFCMFSFFSRVLLFPTYSILIIVG